MRGVYASHVLEHLSLYGFRTAISNTLDMLEPGGVFRLIVPDLEERARRYVAGADKQSPEAAGDFMRLCHLGAEDRASSALARLRTIYGGSAHLWMWDEASLSHELAEVGFVDIRRCEFNDASDEMFSRVEDIGRFVDQGSGIIELAMEARKLS